MKENLGVHYDRSSDFQQAQFDVLKRLISEYTDTDRVKTMLDIGCGTGARTVECFDVFPKLRHVTAFDPDTEMMSVAMSEHSDPRIEYQQMDTDALPQMAVPEFGTFDAVLSNWVLHWVENKESMMQELSRLTHRGSIFMFGTCENLPLILQDVDEFVRQDFHITNSGQSPFHYLNAKQWRDLMEKHGWKVVKQKAYKTPHFARDARTYLEHWFAASTTKFLYGHQMEEIPDIVLSDLVWFIEEKYKDPNFKEGLLFYEDVVFTIAERL